MFSQQTVSLSSSSSEKETSSITESISVSTESKVESKIVKSESPTDPFFCIVEKSPELEAFMKLAADLDKLFHKFLDCLFKNYVAFNEEDVWTTKLDIRKQINQLGSATRRYVDMEEFKLINDRIVRFFANTLIEARNQLLDYLPQFSLY